MGVFEGSTTPFPPNFLPLSPWQNWESGKIGNREFLNSPVGVPGDFLPPDGVVEGKNRGRAGEGGVFHLSNPL